MTYKEIIRRQANIDISNLHIAQEEGIITEFGKGKLEALEGIVDFIDSFEEPSSEDLNKAAEQDVCEVVNSSSAIGIPNDHIPSWVQDAMINEFVHGAKWKEEQFEKNRLKHCNSITNEQAKLEQEFIDQHLDKHQRMPTFLDAIEYGMKIAKEQMMNKAVDMVVGYFMPNGLLLDVDETENTFGIDEGDKVKMIIIKEDLL